MAVAASLALGVLAVLANNGNAAYGQTNVVYGQTNKAWFTVCIWANDWRFDKKTVVDYLGDALGLGFGGGAYIGTTIYLWRGAAKAALIGGLAGFAVIAA